MKVKCKASSTTYTDRQPAPCQRTARDDGYCFQHHPDAPRLGKKPQKSRDEYLAAAQKVLLLEDCYIAVKRIAAGNADPMSLCKNVLNRFAWSSADKTTKEG